MRIYERLRLLPLLVLVALFSFVIRVGEFVSVLRYSGVAYAQHEVEAEPPVLPDAEVAAEDHDGEGNTIVLDESDSVEGAEEVIKWTDPVDTDFAYSGIQQELYKDLTRRREGLEKREGMLEKREALLTAAERELDQKLRELEILRTEIKALLKQQSDEEEAQLISLVKIYEGMKAKDAARIFNTLDTDVLLSVLSRMSERKSAPVLAAMNAERARSVTILLAQQKKLPTLAPQ